MTGTLGRASLWLLTALFVVVIANAAARLTWVLAGETSDRVPDIATALASPQQEPPLDLSPIFALAPFGNPAVAAAPASPAAETTLGLVLRGLIVSEPASGSIAVIALNDGAAKTYGLGDSIEAKAVLKEIHEDKVMLQVGDRVESLSFPKLDPNKGVAKLVAGISNTGVVATTSSVGVSATPVIEEYRRKIAQNPKSVLDGFGVSVSQNGYRIDPNATSLVLRAGFKPGDLISKINGEDVGDIERDRRLFDEVIASGRVRIEVVRDGRTVVMSFPLK